jgi:hypothetical protein
MSAPPHKIEERKQFKRSINPKCKEEFIKKCKHLQNFKKVQYYPNVVVLLFSPEVTLVADYSKYSELRIKDDGSMLCFGFRTCSTSYRAYIDLEANGLTAPPSLDHLLYIT